MSWTLHIRFSVDAAALNHVAAIDALLQVFCSGSYESSLECLLPATPKLSGQLVPFQLFLVALSPFCPLLVIFGVFSVGADVWWSAPGYWRLVLPSTQTVSGGCYPPRHMYGGHHGHLARLLRDPPTTIPAKAWCTGGMRRVGRCSVASQWSPPVILCHRPRWSGLAGNLELSGNFLGPG